MLTGWAPEPGSAPKTPADTGHRTQIRLMLMHGGASVRNSGSQLLVFIHCAFSALDYAKANERAYKAYAAFYAIWAVDIQKYGRR
jgi:hypothetical protein